MTLTLIAILVGGSLVAAAGVQLVIARRFEQQFSCMGSWLVSGDDAANRSQTAKRPQESTVPRVAILMSVRGADPSLLKSVEGALQQDHENYEVHIVVDHETDPAWSKLNQLQQTHANGHRLQLQTMRPPPPQGGLKCHCLAQAVDSLPACIDQVALLDADVVPHTSWLNALTSPLQDPTVGGVTGTQWFEPDVGAPAGSWWRSTWNGGAMIPTIHFANPWAGSFAMRRADLLASGLVETWRVSIVDDGPIRERLGRLGLRIVFAPSLIMINREHCDHSYVLRWTTRMLTWSRLHEPTFYLSQIHATLSNLLMLVTTGVLIASLISLAFVSPTESIPVSAEAAPTHWAAGGWQAAILSACSLIVSGWLCVLAYQSGRRCVAHSCQLRGELLEPMSLRAIWNVFWSAVPAHAAYGLACWRATWIRRISWRGIDYQVRGKADIERLNYEPFHRAKDSTGSI